MNSKDDNTVLTAFAAWALVLGVLGAALGLMLVGVYALMVYLFVIA